MSKPSEYPRWADSGAILVEPTSAQKDKGWVTSQKPPAQIFNYWMNLVYLWTQFWDQLFNPTSPVAGTDSPQILMLDSTGGNNRLVIDHNGYLGGYVTMFREDWMSAFSSTTTATSADGKWSWLDGTAGATFSLSSFSVAPTNARPFNQVKIVPGVQNADDSDIRSTQTVYPSDNASIVLETALVLNNLSNVTWNFGLASGGNLSGSSEAAVFNFIAGTGIFAQTYHSGVGTGGIATGVSLTANTVYNLRIEYHGVNTPIGVAALESVAANTAKVRFFINGTRVVTSGSHIPAGAMCVFLEGDCTGATTTFALLAPVRLSYNHALSIQAL